MNVSGFTRQTLIMRNCTSWNMILSGFITVGSRRFQSLYNSIIDVYTHRSLIGILCMLVSWLGQTSKRTTGRD